MEKPLIGSVRKNMYSSYLLLLTVAIPAIAGSFVVLAFAAVGRDVWITHSLAICLACFLAVAGDHLSKRANRQMTAFTIIVLTLIGLAIPLFGNSPDPERWISIGRFRLYVAPLLLPSFIAACSVLVAKDVSSQIVSFTAVLGAAVLVTIQPDASQVLSLLAASTIIVVRYGSGAWGSGMILFPLVLITMWAFSLPDPLEPVPHVEEVFAFVLGHSLFAGIAVIAGATALIVGLWIQSVKGPVWLAAVAAYYLVLFVSSTTGLTPAPLVGYGAGPVLGFGLLAGLLGWLEPQRLPGKSMQPTVNALLD